MFDTSTSTAPSMCDYSIVRVQCRAVHAWKGAEVGAFRTSLRDRAEARTTTRRSRSTRETTFSRGPGSPTRRFLERVYRPARSRALATGYVRTRGPLASRALADGCSSHNAIAGEIPTVARTREQRTVDVPACFRDAREGGGRRVWRGTRRRSRHNTISRSQYRWRDFAGCEVVGHATLVQRTGWEGKRRDAIPGF